MKTIVDRQMFWTAIVVFLTISTGQTAPLSVRAYWDRAEQRPGQAEELFIRLETEDNPQVPVNVRLLPPPGVTVAGAVLPPPKPENATTALSEAGPNVHETTVTTWGKGEVISNSLKDYFKFRRMKEKRLSSTVSWKIQAEGVMNSAGTVEVNAPGMEPIRIDVPFDFREGPKNLPAGKIPEPIPAEHDYLVGALHYPGWITGQASGWSLLDPFPERRPALGYHDESTVEAASWEIKWALENGIQYFVFCWYLLKDQKPTVENLYLGETLHQGFLKSPFMDRFKFALLWENNVERSGPVPRDRLLGEFMPFWIKTYFQHPSYLVIEGKPVLYVYDTSGFIASQGGTEGAKESVRLMREAAIAAGFKGLWLLGEYRGGAAAPFLAMQEIGFDASFPYCYGLEGPKYNQEALDDIMSLARQQDENSGIPAVATVAASWDVQPWLEYIDYIWHDKPFWLNPSYFKKQVELMKARIDARPGDNPLAKRMVLVDNWNEYGEGHWVAPSRKEGFRYLNAIRDVFAPQAKDQPNVLLEDVGLSPDESRHEAWMKEMRAKLPEPK